MYKYNLDKKTKKILSQLYKIPTWMVVDWVNGLDDVNIELLVANVKGIYTKTGYTRIGIYKIEEVLDYVVFDDVIQSLIDSGLTDKDEEWRRATERQYNGHWVYMDSHRYRCFKTHGIKCVSCGIEGSFMALERSYNACNKGERYHFNMYANIPYINEVLMTKDHIDPVSLGGKDELGNYQTMCIVCNNKKGNGVVK